MMQRGAERTGLRPQETDSAMPVVFSAQNLGRCASIRRNESAPQALFALIEGIGLQDNNVLGILPQTNGVNDHVAFGGVCAVGKLVFGHEGVSQDFFFNISPGAVAKIPFLGSSGDYGPILVPKYFKLRDTLIIGSNVLRTYISNVGQDQDIDNTTFNQPNTSLLIQALTDGAGAPIGDQDNVFNQNYTALARAWFGTGTATNQDDTRAVRKFFGSLAPGTAGNHITRVPIAWNATAVKISGSPLLGFRQLSNGAVYSNDLGDGVGILSGFSANTFVPMQENLEWIDIISTEDTTDEIYFEVIYSFGT